MFTCFVDESGSKNDETVLGLAGVVSSESDVPRGLDLAYALCAQGLASRVFEWAQQNECGPVAYMFERGKGLNQGKAVDALDNLAVQKPSLLIGPVGRDDKRRIPLQPADIWAYEVRKYFHQQLAADGRSLSMRKSLERLCQIPDGLGYALAGNQLHSLVQAAHRDETSFHCDPLPLSFNQRPRIQR